MDVVSQIKKFFEPKSVAIFGVSRRTGKDAFNILDNLLSYGYKGKIYPVNPNATEILGIKTYPDIQTVPEQCDLAILNLPRQIILKVVKECADNGIDSIVIVTQGFGDADDEEGKQLQAELEKVIKGNNIRVLGPNSLGIANAFANFSSSFVKLDMERIPVGLICQTGVFMMGYSFAKFVGKGLDLGNGTDIDMADGLEYFGQDGDIKVVALHIEGMKDGRKFLKAAKKITGKKPVVALKTGKSEQAARAAQSHTGSMAGKDKIWDVGLKQSGIIRVNDIDEFADTVKAFYTLPLMKGNRIAVASYTGGLGIMGIDACNKYGLEIGKLSEATLKRLEEFYPSWQDVGNPADIWPAIMVERKGSLPEIEEMAVDTLLSDPGIDGILCVFGEFLPPGQWRSLTPMIERITNAHPDKPLIFHIYGSFADEAKINIEKTGKALVFTSVDRAMRALGHLYDYSEFCARH
jgi:acetyltransferase